MKSFILTLSLVISVLLIHGQHPVEEGKKLYRSEMASWYGTDVFGEYLRHRAYRVGGYFSYEKGNDINCIFFSNDTIPVTLGIITFDSTFSIQNARIDSTQRALTDEESAYTLLRKKTKEALNTDTIFQYYKNTGFNIIPVIDNYGKRVYVLTGPKTNNVVIFGNDYLVTFDKRNNIKDIQRLHKNIMMIETDKEVQEGVSMHSHTAETGESITATDVCTLMLYAQSAKWTQHYVLAPKQISIWDCKKNSVFVLSRKAWDKINQK
ncbi:hypothetical protein SAMN05444266_109336 [Chitinophaga jiangningensis]|uniref:Uncharacterized protein n=1 Tax=Chitinophaga jiangningensis TaxID=1419482 RepID=A0A1M7KHS0_9BACT|nr:hypothetical protein [Chitinophaga jiangningensis]SHM64918.1 hypothetical protein SAMN05444266_109336 [Chitinophaga jiangningensis]